MIARGGPISEHTLLVFGLMWSPTIAMIVARAVNRDGIRDVSFRPGFKDRGWREYLLAWWFPVVVAALAYGAAWSTGLVGFEVPKMVRETLELGPVPALLVAVASTLTLGTVFSAATAMGEEVGWRGYMLTRLIEAGVPRPVLVSGLVWGLWHTPLILTGQYAAGPWPVLSTMLFLVNITIQSYLYARIRLRTGSVWPAVLLHASWNAVIQAGFDPFVPGHDAANAGNIWVGEAGILVTLVAVTFTLLLVRRPITARAHPNATEATSFRLTAS